MSWSVCPSYTVAVFMCAVNAANHCSYLISCHLETVVHKKS